MKKVFAPKSSTIVSFATAFALIAGHSPAMAEESHFNMLKTFTVGKNVPANNFHNHQERVVMDYTSGPGDMESVTILDEKNNSKTLCRMHNDGQDFSSADSYSKSVTATVSVSPINMSGVVYGEDDKSNGYKLSLTYKASFEAEEDCEAMATMVRIGALRRILSEFVASGTPSHGMAIGPRKPQLSVTNLHSRPISCI